MAYPDRQYHAITFADGVFALSDKDFPRTMTAALDAQHGDWKTALVRDFPTMKAGQVVDVEKVWWNYYGWQATVRIGSRTIDVPPESLYWAAIDAQQAEGPDA